MKDRKIKRKENEEEIIHGKRKDTGRFNDGWPRPHSLSPWQRFDPTRRDKAEANHKPDSSNTSLSCEGGAQVKTKLTTGRLSPTIITSQQSTTSAHFWKGGQGGGAFKKKQEEGEERKEGDGHLCLFDMCRFNREAVGHLNYCTFKTKYHVGSYTVVCTGLRPPQKRPLLIVCSIS